ncbi:hypothetical protein RIF29_33856 [Crotalaria pallida]|uniref:Hflx-type G domain-containing protein n=1 Tax=Crotalaria pallida TaxID=3830 RepID=A0AAN9E896_CROPI
MERRKILCFTSGAGETELQLQRQRILERRNYLLTQIEEVHRTRAVQVVDRKRHGGSYGQVLATVAVVGYTNAGKSTLVSELSNSELYSDCRLFAIVDPRLRSVVLPSGRKVLLSDTVGFISDLPVQINYILSFEEVTLKFISAGEQFQLFGRVALKVNSGEDIDMVV